MNRDLYHPLIIGAIVISVTMAFLFKVNLLVVLIISALTGTLYIEFKGGLTKYLFYLSVSLLIATLSIIRIDMEKKQEFAPLNNFTFDEIRIEKDSIKTIRGYFSNGNVITVSNNQTIVNSNISTELNSETPLYQGEIVNVQNSGKKPKEDKKSKFSSPLFYKRKQLLSIIEKETPSPLLYALLTGNKNSLDIANIELFKKSGTPHILALSGFHVGVITLMIIMVARIFFTGNKIYSIATAILIFYLILVGLTPSLFRSVIMFIIGFIFKLRKKRVGVLFILIISFYVVILIDPKEFYSLSFQLSYLALIGILVIGSEIFYLLKRASIPGILGSSVSASIGAVIATSFIVFPTFEVLYPIGIIASLVITPLITLFMWLGIVTAFVKPLGWMTNYWENLIYYLMEHFSKYPYIIKTTENYIIITFITIIIPVILLILKIYRSVNARRFNLKFKL